MSHPSRLDGPQSLGDPVNKVSSETEESAIGVVGSLLPELKLSMSDEDLLALTSKWKADWAGDDTVKQWMNDNKETKKYYLGKQDEDSGEERPLQDNILFESLETFRAIATRKNPEPTVETLDSTEAGAMLSANVRRMLMYLADTRTLKLKLKKVLLYWSLYRLGVMKVVWDLAENELDVRVLRPQKLILDPNATIEDGQYSGEYIGEYREATAKALMRQHPEKAEFIKQQASGKLNTKLRYIEWWTSEYVCWELNQKILGKIKNPHYNYEQIETTVDDFGFDVGNEVAGSNHFILPRMPYMFLSVFNLGEHPMDDTSLMMQNLAQQDLVNKRHRQIDRNADNLNGGWAISGELAGITKGQAEEAIEVFNEGGAIYIPKGDVNRAVAKMVGQALPGEVYNQLVDTRTEIRNNMGVRGSTPQGIQSEKTVRGKIITSGQDADRISLVSDHLEQLADQVFNWWVQMFYVYYDQPHYASMIGDQKAQEAIAIQSSDLTSKLLVSVKEGSLIPKDPLTVRNEAIDLWSAGALDPISLYKALDFPNPEESAQKLLLWKTNPMALFQDQGVAQPIQPAQPATPDGQNSLEQPDQPQDILSAVPLQPVA